jgi:hypothetical protein
LLIGQDPKFEAGTADSQPKTVIDRLIEWWLAKLHRHKCGSAFYVISTQFGISIPTCNAGADFILSP